MRKNYDSTEGKNFLEETNKKISQQSSHMPQANIAKAGPNSPTRYKNTAAKTTKASFSTAKAITATPKRVLTRQPTPEQSKGTNIYPSPRVTTSSKYAQRLLYI